MASVLEPVVFDPVQFERELNEFESLLTRPDLGEQADIQPFFKQRKHLASYLGTFAPNIGPATHVGFEFDLFGDFRADVLLGNKQAKEFCVVEFEDGGQNSIFRNQPRRKNPEWSAKFEHAFSQLTDWFYSLHDMKGTESFINTFGAGEIAFFGLIVMGRNSELDDAKRSRLKWRSERVLIDSHKASCITFDELHSTLQNRFGLYRAALEMESPREH